RRGPRVGLITTEGHEDAILIGRGAQWTDGTRLAERRNLAAQHKPEPLVPRGLIVGVKERIDSTGTVMRPLDEDDVRRKLRILMIHNSGGSGEVFKTTASRTYNGGPVSGLMGSYHLAQSLGYHNVVAGDMGGTSFDIGLVVGDSVRNYEFRPVIDRWMVSITMLQTLSIGAGGGSIASINP